MGMMTWEALETLLKSSDLDKSKITIHEDEGIVRVFYDHEEIFAESLEAFVQRFFHLHGIQVREDLA